MRNLCLFVLAALALWPGSLGAQEADVGTWSLVPELGVAFHSTYYDDRVVTDFADGDVDLDRLAIDPGTSVRLGLRAEYAAAPGFRIHGGVAGSWPDAEVEVNGLPRPDMDVSVLELGAGALLELGQLAADSGFPFYVAGDLVLYRHSFDDLRWEDRFLEVGTTSLALKGRLGAEYEVAPGFLLRGELAEAVVRGGFGDLEEEIARAEAEDENQPAETDLEGNTFSQFSLNAGLAVRL